ncbi:hypothetical protein JCM10207_001380 [Rhodosporidiobolus poonsookiae]
MGKLLGRVWVTGTVLLIAFLHLSPQLFLVVPSFPSGLRDPACLRLVVPFNALLLLLYINYYLCVTTDPGRVPAGWEPDWRMMEQGEVEVKKLTGGPRYCRTCRAYKPPRAHHCRQCGRCVLKMDHHCPWVNNCVGHANYGHFCRFLFFVDVACSFHLWMVTKRALVSFSFFIEPSTTQIVMLILNYVLCVVVLFAVGVFSLFHLWSVLTNTTTIEGWEKDKVATLKRRGKIREYRYPYHLGYLSNLRAVLGSNPLLWCWPQPSPGDGLSYPTAIGTSTKDQLVWPPRDEHVPLRKARQPLPVDPNAAFTYGDGLNPSLHGPSPARSSALQAVEQHMRQRRRRPAAQARPPWMAGDEADDDPSADDEPRLPAPGEDDDDVPLGTLAARQQRVCLGGAPGAVEEDELNDRLGPAELEQAVDDLDEGDEDLDPDRSVRIRRGSEGYEIRPRMGWGAAGPAYPGEGVHGAEADEASASDDDSWERLERQPGYVEDAGREAEEEEEESEWEVDDEGDRRRVGARYRYYVREEDSESDLESLRSVSDE